jgi:hypothetical protein
MASRGFTTGMSFALLTKKMETVSKIREESRRNQELINKRNWEDVEIKKLRIREKSEISSALKETNRLTQEMKDRIERRLSMMKEKARENIKKDVLNQISRNDRLIEENKNNVRIKKLQEILGTEETDLNRLERLNMRRQKKIKKMMVDEEIERKKAKVEQMLIEGDMPKINIGVGTEFENQIE